MIKGFSTRRTRGGIAVARVHYTADPTRGKQWAKAERAKYSSQAAWDREQEIVHEAGAGDPIFLGILQQWGHKIIISDPKWKAPKSWTPVPGLDHGKKNPTAALVARIDYDGTIYLCGEYYMPELGPSEHAENLRELPGFMEADRVFADPSIFGKTQAQADGNFKSIADLYQEVGIEHLVPAQNAELAGIERLLHHWRDLEHREPTVKIVCRNPYDKKQYGLFPNDCPNTLWELMRTRREKLTAVQLMRKNPTEAIVDRDNHLRDCLKGILLALPEPTEKPRDIQMEEATKDMDPMNAFLTKQKMEAGFKKQDAPIMSGGNAVRRHLTKSSKPFGRRW